MTFFACIESYDINVNRQIGVSIYIYIYTYSYLYLYLFILLTFFGLGYSAAKFRVWPQTQAGPCTPGFVPRVGVKRVLPAVLVYS